MSFVTPAAQGVRTVDLSDTSKAPFIDHEPPMKLGEGPLYRASDNTLHYLDIMRSPASALYIAQLTDSGDLASPPREVELTGSRFVTAIAFIKDQPGTYLCTTNTGLAYLDEATGKLTNLPNDLGFVVPEDKKDELRFNDAYVDAHGRFYFHTMSLDESAEIGSLYMYEKGMQRVSDLKVLEKDFAIGNGPAVDAERNLFYFNETSAGKQWVYEYDPATGLISNKRLNFDNHTRRPKALTDPASTLLGPGYPDGMMLDTKGRVYVATFFRACIERFLPDGTPDLVISLPARCPTCPVWGGKNLTQLYITTASKALTLAERTALNDQGGDILRVDMTEHLDGAKGVLKHEVVL